MKDNLNTINERCVADGYLFATPTDRYHYVGQWSWEKAQWLKQNPDKWRRREDSPQTAAPKCGTDVSAAEPPSASAPPPDARGEPKDQDTDGSAEMPATASPPAEHVKSTVASATAALSPSEIAKNAISIGGHPHVSTTRLASMLGVSERTLSRLLANGNGPTHVKIGGNYYPLDKVREWAAARGLPLKTPSDTR
jgi:hypothetical protein